MKKIILSMALLAAGFTCSYAASIEDMTKDALINSSEHTVLGTFGQHDFPGVESTFDWAFTMASNGASYQLKGNPPSAADAFGWKPANITKPTPLWYMFSVDIDGDGIKGPFEWVLLSTDLDHKAVYKLAGANNNGTFAYSKKIDIDYTVDGNTITTGAVGTLDDDVVVEPTPQPVDNDPNKLHVTHASDLYGYTIKSIETEVGTFDAAQMTYIIDCSGNFTTILKTELGSMTITGNSIDADRSRADKTILFLGVDNDGQEAREWIYYKNDNNDIIIDQSVAANAEGWYIESITKNSTCN